MVLYTFHMKLFNLAQMFFRHKILLKWWTWVFILLYLISKLLPIKITNNCIFYRFHFMEQQMVGSEYLGYLLGIRNKDFHVKSIKSWAMGHRIIRKVLNWKLWFFIFIVIIWMVTLTRDSREPNKKVVVQ